jgi:predicted transcriptional regulator
MGRRGRHADDPRLTDAELEIMNALWTTGEADVADIAAALGDGRAYTTVATLLKILENKGFATSRKYGRKLLYAPASARPTWQSATVGDLVRRVFAGDAKSLVRSLLDSGEVDADELAAIKKLLEERK